MIKLSTTLISLAVCLATPAAAVELALPATAKLTADAVQGPTSQRLAIGPYANGEVMSIWAEGAIRQEAWQSPASGRTTLQLIEPLRAQLEDQGFEILFQCRDVDCGGFDFRYAQEILPEPEMHIDLGDFRFLSAQRMTDTQPEYVALIASRNRAQDYLHVTRIGTEAPELTEVSASTKNDAFEGTLEVDEGAIADVLEARGVAVLEDLDFSVGSSNLTDGQFPSIEALANYLLSKPNVTVALVGHTDAVGSMEANFRLSKARAAAVRSVLVSEFGIAQERIDAQGVGYLAPLASNLSEDGRMLNRRVEVVLTSVN